MDQCSWHDTPPAFSVDLTNRSGRALRLELVVQIVLALTDQRFGDIFTKVAMSCTIRLWTSALRHEPARDHFHSENPTFHPTYQTDTTGPIRHHRTSFLSYPDVPDITGPFRPNASTS
jgi:hypothetical protein